MKYYYIIKLSFGYLYRITIDYRYHNQQKATSCELHLGNRSVMLFLVGSGFRNSGWNCGYVAFRVLIN